MNVVFRHAWMQKHPTPTRASGDFHWHPADIPEPIRATLTDLTNRSRGSQASVWIIDPQYVAWARAFSAVSPADRRRYTGLVATIAQPDAAAERAWPAILPEVLAWLPLPPAGPFATGHALGTSTRIDAAPGTHAPLAIDPEALGRLFTPGDTALAAAVWQGGLAVGLQPHAERMPAMLGRLISWLPPGERARSRSGAFLDSRAQVEARAAHSRGEDTLLHYLTSAWSCPPAIRQRDAGYPGRAWSLVLDLEAAGRTAGGAPDLAALFADLSTVAASWDTAANLHGYLLACGALSAADIAACDQRAPAPLVGARVADAGWLWNRLLHYWGRGFLPEQVLPRLAGLLARRVTVDHLFHLDSPEQTALPQRYLRRLAYEALLDRQHVSAMLHAVNRYLPTLSYSREVLFG